MSYLCKFHGNSRCECSKLMISLALKRLTFAQKFVYKINETS
jgi:hypothetical protein